MPDSFFRGQETILVVEDEEAVRLTVDLFLKSVGYSVFIASTPQEALNFEKRFPDEIHLLVADLGLPGMSGHDLARQLVEHRPALKCLYMSGNQFLTSRLTDAGNPDVTFLAKPFTFSDLSSKVREALA